MDFNNYDIIVAGAGLSGCTIAERFASQLNKKVLILEKRDHIGGNCYDYIDEETGILVSKYGAHLFHTNSEEVWNYINKFGKWIRWEHKVLGIVENHLVPIPVNITTVNKLCNQNIESEKEMNDWLSKKQIKYETIKNGEEMAKSRVGEELYEKLFKNYTFKQWGKYPSELKPEVLARIPIRNNLDDRYFSDKYQALPEKGYTEFFKSLTNHSNITVKLRIDFKKIKNTVPENKIVVYTGPIDSYFSGENLEKLEYRSINFIREVHKNINYYQTNSVINYPGNNTEFTRIVEYKHFLNQESKDTIIFKEITTNIGEPYYPVLNDRNLKLYENYKILAEKEMENKNVHFLGRLANYKYFNMDEAIANSLKYFNKKFFTVKIVVAHYNENLDWVKNLNYDYEIISRNGIPIETPPNKGNEASTYLEFIIKNYDNLPDICIFVHGHRNSWHHKENMDEKLNRIEFTKTYKNLNDFPLDNLSDEKFKDAFNYLKTKQFLLDYINSNVYPEDIKYKSCSQFYVKREAILSRSIDFYKNLYQWLMCTEEPSYWSGRFFEYTWHIIFTNNPIDED